jgi:hypothetical protein
MRVTAFRQYIQCPYRFYLNVVLKLKSAVDDWRELAPAMFGTLAHEVVQDFGKSSVKDSDDAETIRDFLNDQLSSHAARGVPGSRLPAVRIQIEQLRLRLNRFAVCQALQRQLGWRIVAIEQSLEHAMVVDGSPFVIRGTIDRIDVNETSRAVAIWDYKTGDKGDSPDTAHGPSKKREWKDLQLPLYRHLAKELDVLGSADWTQPQLGYILLPKSLDAIDFAPARWTADQLDHADETAVEIIRNVRQHVFWPPSKTPPDYSEDFAAICQDKIFEQFPVPEWVANGQIARLPETCP